MTSSSGRGPSRARLAEHMDQRRRELRLTWDQVASRAGINRETLRQIRNGISESIRPLTAAGIEDALQWEHGSIDAILAGGAPTPTGGGGQEVWPPMAEEMADLRRQLAELRERLDRFEGRNQHRGTG